MRSTRLESCSLSVRSAGMTTHGVDSSEARDSSLSALLATSQIESSLSASRALQNSAPIPEDAPVTIAIIQSMSAEAAAVTTTTTMMMTMK